MNLPLVAYNVKSCKPLERQVIEGTGYTLGPDLLALAESNKGKNTERKLPQGTTVLETERPLFESLSIHNSSISESEILEKIRELSANDLKLLSQKNIGTESKVVYDAAVKKVREMGLNVLDYSTATSAEPIPTLHRAMHKAPAAH